MDNIEGGEVIFINSSHLNEFWTNPRLVDIYFRRLGTPNVRHYRVTTPVYAALGDIGLLMIDGLHTAEQARVDYLSFLDKLAENAIVLFHDSVRERVSLIYGEDRLYTHTVCRFMERQKETPGLELFTIPFADGVTLAQGRPETLDHINRPFDAQ